MGGPSIIRGAKFEGSLRLLDELTAEVALGHIGAERQIPGLSVTPFSAPPRTFTVSLQAKF